MDRVRVLIADDQRRVRDGLKALLAASSAGTPMRPAEIEVVGQAETGLEAVRLAGELQPDVVVMDVRMPGMDGLQATRLIKARWPHIRVVLLTLYADERQQELATAADAFLEKGGPIEGLVAAVGSKPTTVGWNTRRGLFAQSQAMPIISSGIGASILLR